MNALLYYDAVAIFYLQHYLYHIPHLGEVATTISSLGDPRYSYIIVFPIVYWLLGATAGYHVILTAAIGEWLNITLKWLLLGNRPYWWVWLHTDWPHLLHQSPATCETGPGNPSGHVMITLAVLLTCADYIGRRRKPEWRGAEKKKGESTISRKRLILCEGLTARNKEGERENGSGEEEMTLEETEVECGWRRRGLKAVVWGGVLAIAGSRLIISTHFLHQVVCGVIVGVVLHQVVSHFGISHSQKTINVKDQCNGLHGNINADPPLLHSSLLLLTLSTLMLVMGLFLYRMWTWLGMDPGFSIPLAMRFCEREEWVHLDTTPFYSLMRSSGTLGGVALMIALRPFLGPMSTPRFHYKTIIGLLVCWILIGCLRLVPIATGTSTFYIESFSLCAAVPVIVGGVDWVMGRGW